MNSRIYFQRGVFAVLCIATIAAGGISYLVPPKSVPVLKSERSSQGYIVEISCERYDSWWKALRNVPGPVEYVPYATLFYRDESLPLFSQRLGYTESTLDAAESYVTKASFDDQTSSIELTLSGGGQFSIPVLLPNRFP